MIHTQLILTQVIQNFTNFFVNLYLASNSSVLFITGRNVCLFNLSQKNNSLKLTTDHKRQANFEKPFHPFSTLTQLSIEKRNILVFII